MVLVATPGVIGAIGAATGRGTVLVAAGVLCLMQSVIAFSGVTLVYVIPALGFLHAASGGPVMRSEGFGPGRVLMVVGLFLLGLLIAFTIGILGVLAVVLLVVTASAAAGRRQRLPGAEALRGVAIVALLVGAWIASFAFVETVCWVGRHAPDGGIAWERIPPTNTLTLGPGDVASTCDSGSPAPIGVAVVGGAIVAALAVSALPRQPRRRGEPSTT
ncbi:MAG TPA: hypothetical protein VF231_03305 [Candidatus Limnocylindrales bacterium]